MSILDHSYVYRGLKKLKARRNKTMGSDWPYRLCTDVSLHGQKSQV